MLYILAAIAVIALDQLVKYLVFSNIALNTGSSALLPGIVSLVHIHNKGAAFSFLAGANGRLLFIIICLVFTAAIVVALIKGFPQSRLERWCLVLIAAGGLSNCLDRIFRGYVVDMFRIEFFNFAIFNIADIFITVFCFVFVLSTLFSTRVSKT